MESIFGLLTILFNLTLVGGVVMFIFKVLKFRKKSDFKNEIDNLQAQISLLRISLKAKVKKKSFTFRSQFPKPLITGDLIDTALNELIENKLETGKELQAYFDLSRRINSFLVVNIQGYSPIEDFMSNDFKNEISIIRLIKDISSLSARLNKRSDSYNLTNQSAKLATVDNLIFTSMIEVNRIFNDTPEVHEETPPVAKKPAA
ncbi:MAG: hypothetical protein H7328_00420 [Bdellovibrio sp.]|nr:hypothetical protein [Bdellovibrio sp.]